MSDQVPYILSWFTLRDYLNDSWNFFSLSCFILQVKHLRTKDIEEDGGIGIPTIEAASQVPTVYSDKANFSIELHYSTLISNS